MNPENFCYWLQGYVELQQNPPTPEQWESIKDHLATVFNKVTPQVSNPSFTVPMFGLKDAVTC